jgi:hypothetical protein
VALTATGVPTATGVRGTRRNARIRRGGVELNTLTSLAWVFPRPPAEHPPRATPHYQNPASKGITGVHRLDGQGRPAADSQRGAGSVEQDRARRAAVRT